MNQSSVIVFGEALVDLFKDGLVVGGAPFNVARHLAGFGAQPLFISAIGIDNAADLILQECKQFKLSSIGIQVFQNHRTGVVQVHENVNGHQFEIMADCAYDYVEASAALAAIQGNSTQQSKLLYHGTLGLRGHQSQKSFKAICKAIKSDTNSQIFLDINWRDGHTEQAVAANCLQNAHIIKVSIEELQMLFGWFNLAACKSVLPHTGNIDTQIKALLGFCKAHLLLVTYGDFGSAAFDQQGHCIAVAPAIKSISVIDTVGAGDAFSSVMLLAIEAKWPIGMALQRANMFAADICKIRGATPQDLELYQKHLKAWKSNA